MTDQPDEPAPLEKFLGRLSEEINELLASHVHAVSELDLHMIGDPAPAHLAPGERVRFVGHDGVTLGVLRVDDRGRWAVP